MLTVLHAVLNLHAVVTALHAVLTVLHPLHPLYLALTPAPSLTSNQPHVYTHTHTSVAVCTTCR